MKIGIVSDIHEDIIMLKKAMRIFEHEQCDTLVCLGDITGFSGNHYIHAATKNAHQCIEIIKHHFHIAVTGNHDLFTLKKLPEHKAGVQYPENWFELTVEEQQKVVNNKVWLYEDEEHVCLKDQDIDFLNSLPEYQIMEQPDGNILFSHYLFPDFTGSLKHFHTDIYDFMPHIRYMKEKNIKFSFCGHSHIEGTHIAYASKLRRKRFKKMTLKNRLQCIAGPVLASGSNAKGLMIFEPSSLILNIVKL
ncbi:MAG: metallophosphoesterase family protein [Bacteroidota bacterium]